MGAPADSAAFLSGGDLYSFENLWRQYLVCRSNKRGTLNALAFEVDAEANILALQQELRAHTYRPGRSICFVSAGPKPREVFAADFRDRIVHHVLVSRQEPRMERRFIHDSFACRRGKGTLAGSDRLMQFLASATANGRRAAWALRLDVAQFFPSIHKATLYDLLSRAMPDPELCWLTRVLLFHDPTKDFRFRSVHGRVTPPGQPGYPVPERKSLFGRDNLRGLPIGNLTSQFWANVYLDQLDQFVKHELRCRHYLRYVDDMVLLADGPETLRIWRERIAVFLRERLGLELRPGTRELFAVREGIEFVGWKTWWDHRVPRRQTTGNLVSALHRFGREHGEPAFGGRALRIGLCLVFWREGRYVEFHGPQRLLAERVLGLAPVRIGRGDYALTAGFPTSLTKGFVLRAIGRGVSVLLPRNLRAARRGLVLVTPAEIAREGWTEPAGIAKMPA